MDEICFYLIWNKKEEKPKIKEWKLEVWNTWKGTQLIFGFKFDDDKGSSFLTIIKLKTETISLY